MADDTLKHQLRSRIIQAGGPRMLSAVARHRGWPSAQALERGIAAGAKLSQGGSLTAADIDACCRDYPNIPRHVIAAYAGRINAAEPGRPRRDALIQYFGFGGNDDNIVQEIDRYATVEVAQAINARRAERDPAPQITAEVRNHPVRRHNDDAADRRALLERQLPEPNEFRPGANYREVRHELADRMEHEDALYQSAERAGANSRKDDVAFAYDSTHNSEQAEAVLGVADLIEPLAEATSGDNPS